MQDENKRVVLGCLEAANSHEAIAFDSYYTENVIYHGNGGETRGRENLKAHYQAYFDAFPDLTLTVEDIFAEGDRVFSRARLQGTNIGEFNGLPPTRNRIDVRWVMTAARLEGGKIVEEWEILDEIEVMRQLGLLGSVPATPSV